MARGYRRLWLADEDEIWERLRAGHAAKPTARALGFPTGTVRAYLVRCVRRDPACSAAKAAGTVEFERAGRDLAWSGRESVAAGHRASTPSAQNVFLCRGPLDALPINGHRGAPVRASPCDFGWRRRARNEPLQPPPLPW
jgi:hypothetical protein